MVHPKISSMIFLADRPFKRIYLFFIVVCLLSSSLFTSAQIFEDKGYWSELMRYNILPVDSFWLFHPGNERPVSANNSSWELVNTKLLTDEKGQQLQDWVLDGIEKHSKYHRHLETNQLSFGWDNLEPRKYISMEN